MNKYGNVKTLTQAGFYGYGSTEKVRIAGKLAQILSKRLSFKDTIVIEFLNVDSNVYPKTIVVENGNSSSDYLICSGLEYFKEKQQKSYLLKHGQNAICIRQVDSDFNIENTLKLIEYCIINKLKTKINSIKFNDYKYLPEIKTIESEYLGLTNNDISEIVNKEKSKTLDEIMKENINFFTFSDIDGFYKNGFYCFKTENIEYEIKNILYLIILEKGICVFENNDSFVYLSKNVAKIKKHEASIDGNYSYIKSRFSLFEKGTKLLENNSFMLYKFSDSKGIIFSEEKNEIVRFVNM